MKIEEQYNELQNIKKEMNKFLLNLDRDGIKKLSLMFVKSPILKKLFLKDNQLYMLNCFCSIWISEQKKLAGLDLDQNIFEDIKNLGDVEEKYCLIKFGVLRLEFSMPKAYYDQIVEYFIESHISGIALFEIIKNETLQRKKNIITLANLLKNKKEYPTALILLQEGEKLYPGEKDLLLEQAECWSAGQQWGQACQCLLRIKSPDTTVSGLIRELENAMTYETI